LVFNKEDKVDSGFVRQSCRRYNAISLSALSALQGKNLEGLLSKMEELLWKEIRPDMEISMGRT